MAYLKSYFALVLFGFLGVGIGGITPNAKAAASANLDQGQNGTPSAPISPVEWVNGNVNASKAHYVEGYSVSYRAVITGLSTGAHNLKIEWDNRSNGKAGIDYITHFQRLQPHNQFGVGHTTPETVDPVSDIAGIFSTNTFPIPAPSSAGSTVPGQPTASFIALPAGERLMTIYNGTITNLTYVSEGNLTNNNSATQLSIDFIATNSTVVIAWGGHIGSKQDWGIGNSASGISGSPYHTRVIELDGSGGNQDRALAAASVVSPPFCDISGPNPACPLTTNLYTVTTDTTNVTYNWFLTNNTAGASITGPVTNPVVQVISGASGTYDIYITILTSGGVVSSTCGETIVVGTNLTASALTNQAACPGQNVTFTTIPSGTGPFTFVWRKNAVLIAGATNNSFSLTNVTSTNAGTYSVEVAGLCNKITNSASLVVHTNTTATPLTNVVRCSGDSVTFATTAAGTGPFTYVWRKDGTLISGATTASYSIPSLQTNDAGSYCVEVYGLCNSVTNCALLTVNPGTTITPLANSTNCPGTTATFTTTASGAGPFSYVWKKGSVVIPGETNDTLTINPVTQTNAGTYTVEVTGTCNTVSSSASLVVLQPIAILPLTPTNACEGASATFTIVATGSGPLTYLWRHDGNEIVGETNNSITISPVSISNTGTYSVEITGPCGSTNSAANLTLATNTSALALTSLTLCPGQTANFSTLASGTGPFSYQWTKDGSLLSGATNSSLTITNVSSSEAGEYCIEVTGKCNTITNCASLTVKTNTAATALTSLTLCPGETASFSTVASGTGPFSYQWTKDGSPLGGETNSTLAISNVNSLNAGQYCVEVSGNCNSVTNCANLTIKTNTSATALTSITLCPGATANFSTIASGTGPFSYQWTKDGLLLNGETNSSLAITNISSLDAGEYCVEVSGNCNSVTNCASLTVKTNTAATALASLTLCPGATANFSTLASGTGPFTYQWTKDGAPLSGETNNSLAITNISSFDAGQYCVAVTGNCNSVTNCATLTVKTNTSASALTSLTLCPGAAATFSTLASGTGPFSYQWTKDGSLLTGETNNSLTISNVSSLDAGQYCIEVTGNCNSVTNCANLTVKTNASATALASLTLCPGATATFSTLAGGTGPFSYQWTRDGLLLNGETNNSLTITNINSLHGGQYCVEVTGNCTSVTNCATLTVKTNTSATALTSLILCPGATANFSTIASGTGPFSYQWTKDGLSLTGETNNSLTITNISSLNAGGYCVEVTGNCTSVTNCATLTVKTNTSATALTSLTLCPGAAANFSTIASGTGPFSYQWTKDGLLISGETNNSLTITNVSSLDAGQYCVAVTGDCNSVTNCASLTVKTNTSASALTSLTLCPGATANFSTTASGTGPFSYQWTRDGLLLNNETNNSLTITNISSLNAGSYCVEVTGNCTSVTNCATLTVKTNTSATALTSLTLCPGGTASFSTLASGTGPFIYQWTKDGLLLTGETNNSLTITNINSLNAGSYCVEVTGDCNSVTNCANLTVKTNTSASALTSLTLCPGATANFSTIASGTGPFIYQWTKNGLLLNAETNNSLTITNVSSLDAGQYCIEVTGNCTSVTNCATLTVKTNTAATALTSLTLCPGATANFSTLASGTGPFIYQWTKDGLLLNGETNSSLTITNISSINAGQYCVEVAGNCNNVTNCATLTVKTNTSATALTSLTLCPGATANFSTIASGTGPFIYQWTKDGLLLNGETNSSLAITNISSLNAGLYCVEVNGNCTSVTNCATLTVKTNTSATALTSLTLCPGATANFSTIASGTGPFTYQWTKDGAPLNGATNSSLAITNISSLNAGLYCVAVTGNCTSVTNCATLTVKTNTSATALTSLTLCPGATANFSTIASGTGPFSYQWTKEGAPLSGETNSSLAITNISSLNAGLYCVEVTGNCNSVTNCATLTVKTNTSATALTSLTLCPGATANFSTIASGTGPFSYQWTKDGAPLSNQTNSSLAITNISSLNAGLYCVEITGNCTSVTNCATLTVKTNTSATALTSLTLCPGATANFSTIASGTGPFTYQWTKDGAPLSNQTNSSLAITNISSLNAGLYCVEVNGNCTSVTNCATLTVKTNTSATAVTSLTLCPGQTASFSTVASGTGPFTYQWTKDGAPLSNQTNSSLTITNITSINAGQYCVAVTGNCTSVTNCASLTVKTNTSATALTSLTLCPGQTASFSTIASGTGPFTYQWTKDGAPLSNQTNSSLTITNVASINAGQYCVEVTGNCTSVTNCATLTVKTNTSATALTSLTLCPGQTANFSTIASGTGPFTYQWTKGGAALNGQTNSSLTITNLSAIHAGQYCVEVTGNCTSVTNCATLTVKTNTAATELTSLTLCPGETAGFSTIVGGTGPFTYQWTKGGVPLNGQTNSSLIITNISAIHAGQYCVEVTGNCTSVTNCATLTVKTNTSATPLSSLTLCPGQLASFSTVASGTGPFTYQWTLNGTNLDGAIGSSYNIPSVSTNHAGTYCVVVSGNCNSITNCATLTVLTPKLTITKFCPPNPVAPGGLLAYSGIVSNSGSATLTNIVLVINQPTNNTPLLGPITLLPGQATNFSGSYLTPAQSCGGWIDTLTATAKAACTGNGLTNTLTTVCPSTTTPAVAVTVNCPPAPVPLGQPLPFSGVVSNSGNASLTNVTVVINQPTNDTPVFGPVTLAPGQALPFNGSYPTPIDSCQTTASATVTARGRSGCNGNIVTASVIPQCPVVTAPRLALVKYCPTNPVAPGGLFTFTGTVSNAGNVTLTNVFVFNDRPTNNTPVIGPITLAPGASTNFSGSYTVCVECCGPYVDTLTAVGKDRCTGSNVTASATASCAGSTTPLLAVTKNCPPGPVLLGNPLTISGTVSNAGNVVLNNVTLSDSQAGYIGLITALAPGEVIGYVASYMPTNCGSNVSSTVKATGFNACNGNAITNTLTKSCEVKCSTAQPITLLNPQLQGGLMKFSFQTQTGFLYRVEFTPSLSATTVWQFLTNIPGTGSGVQIQDPMNQPQRFYRVWIQ